MSSLRNFGSLSVARFGLAILATLRHSCSRPDRTARFLFHFWTLTATRRPAPCGLRSAFRSGTAAARRLRARWKQRLSQSGEPRLLLDLHLFVIEIALPIGVTLDLAVTFNIQLFRNIVRCEGEASAV